MTADFRSKWPRCSCVLCGFATAAQYRHSVYFSRIATGYTHSNLGDILHEIGRTSDAEVHQKVSAAILSDIDTVEGITRPEIWKLVEW